MRIELSMVNRSLNYRASKTQKLCYPGQPVVSCVVVYHVIL